MRAGFNSKQLAAQLVYLPRHWMPLAGAMNSKRPLKVFRAQATGNMRILVDECVIIPIYKLKLANLPVAVLS